jgi:hypothetical protein
MEWIVAVVYLTVSLLGYTPEAAERSIDLSDAVLVLRGLFFLFAVFLAVVMIYRNKFIRYLMALGADITQARSVCCRFASAEYQTNKLEYVVLLMIVLLGAMVRAIYLNDPIRGDEAYTFSQFSNRSLFLGLSQYYTVNNHLLNTFLIHLFVALFGNEEWVIRLPAFVAGICVVPATYVVYRCLYNSSIGLIAAALVGSSSALIEFSVNGRGYSLLCLSFLVLLWAVILARRTDNRLVWITYTLAVVAGCYTLPIMVIPCGMAGVFLLMSIVLKDSQVPQLRIMRHFVGYSGIAGVLLLAMYWPTIIMGGFVEEIAGWTPSRDKWEFFRQLPGRMSLLGAHWTRDWPEGIEYVVFVSAIGSVFLSGKLRGPKTPLLVSVIVVVVVLFLFRPLFYAERFWLFLIPIILGESVAGAAAILIKLKLHRRFRTQKYISGCAMLLAVMLSLSVLQAEGVRYSTDTGTFLGGRAVANYLARAMRAGDVATSSNYSSANLRYYLDKNQVTATLTWDYEDMVKSSRIFLIVNQLYHELPEDLVEDILFSKDGFSQPVKIATFEASDVYVMKSSNAEINAARRREFTPRIEKLITPPTNDK